MNLALIVGLNQLISPSTIVQLGDFFSSVVHAFQEWEGLFKYT